MLAPFNATNISGQVAANAETLQAQLNNLAVQYKTQSVFGFLSYEFADCLKASLQLNYGTTFSKNNSVPFIRIGAQAPFIRVDNPFLPEAVRAQAIARGLTALQVGTTNINNVTSETLSYDNFVNNAVGVPVATTDRTLKRGVFSVEGSLAANGLTTPMSSTAGCACSRRPSPTRSSPTTTARSMPCAIPRARSSAGSTPMRMPPMTTRLRAAQHPWHRRRLAGGDPLHQRQARPEFPDPESETDGGGRIGPGHAGLGLPGGRHRGRVRCRIPQGRRPNPERSGCLRRASIRSRTSRPSGANMT
jgi:hypothetical protein